MSFDVYDDYEQGERVQQWLRKNGVSIAVGIALGLVLIFGWQQWKSHRAGHEQAAAGEYSALQAAVAQNNANAIDVHTETLLKDYADTAWSVFAAGERAQRNVMAGQLDKASGDLDWAVAHAKDDALKTLVQLRVAQLKFAQNKPQDALTALDAMPGKSFVAIAQELRGDALVKLGRHDDARKAYQAAIAAMGDSAPQRGVVQTKLDDLAVAGKQGA
ncbi:MULTISPECIES: YfgM family protein [Rhodanobacteraceae]|jgi:predicted negative regulator of RcsB-dependent stress response|uniref:YfgM family protein n=1 Tax=Rhodanobacteraceae TaxID=1775411 RepID=UPI000566949E|nr:MULTISPECIES: tetratricopeptide repeat protein [Rhodanobacteraceae]MDR6641055.1 putative negative regulator of RcsB-dependent stress response [Luteibacter sp. 1214]SDF47104.1 Putative negative regulator of RcsB-dependent stress response [Dyella sp. 333MFSha]SKB26105.1 Putative negative regulator of RcsB-dependent stress response [Luteibacter sp. 22Crub2.1]